MPTETPHGTEDRTAPSSRAHERPADRSSASRTAISSTALAMKWPLNGSRTEAPRDPSTSPAAAGLGIMKRRSTSAVISTYSEAHSGSDLDTHSPQPSVSAEPPPPPPD